MREVQTEVLGLDAPGRVHDRHRYQVAEAFSEVGAAGRHVERRDQLPLVVVDRRICAGKQRVAREEVLAAVDREGPLFDQAGADAVGAFAILAPHGAGPQAPFAKDLVVGRRAAPLDRHAVLVGQQHAAPDTSNRSIKPIEACLRDRYKRLETLARQPEFGVGQPHRGSPIGRLEVMQVRRPLPGRNQSGARGLVGLQCVIDSVGVCRRVNAAHVSSRAGLTNPPRPKCGPPDCDVNSAKVEGRSRPDRDDRRSARYIRSYIERAIDQRWIVSSSNLFSKKKSA